MRWGRRDHVQDVRVTVLALLVAGLTLTDSATLARPRPLDVRMVARKPPLPPPLNGRSFDFDYDGRTDGHPERRWAARIFVHDEALRQADNPLPLLVFLHGTNAEKIKYRWMGGGAEGDVRRLVSQLIEAKAVPPMLVAAPSSVDPSTIANAMTSWPAFDLDLFLDKAQSRLAGVSVIDRGRVVVAAHSGGGCNPRGGLRTALRASSTKVLAGFSIDSCLLADEAIDLVHVRSTTHVVVAWQTMSWTNRGFDDFKHLFQRELKKAPAPPGILRELSVEAPTEPMPHDAMVGVTLRRWLPRVLMPAASAKPRAPDGKAP
jgi:hypothetical protein